MKGDEKDEGTPLIPDTEFDEQVERAYKFLTHAKVASASLERRIAFLESKECPPEVIQMALKRAELEAGPQDRGYFEPDEVERAPKKKTPRRKPGGRHHKRRKGTVGVKASSDLSGYFISCCFFLAALAIAVGVYFLLVYVGVAPSVFGARDDDGTSSSSNASSSQYSYAYSSYSYAYYPEDDLALRHSSSNSFYDDDLEDYVAADHTSHY
ncbi:hypothetical protein CTAYLR_008013 [Chrysophaeum taylorii]|uniref:Peroxisome membrane anchor protein Pex14p N-terminal domain-containing protein n=1 Tax=Chrysophaeum taylorii TaxID=2483200 RepID=A0AAD7UDI9_9STRA|nr:hypothetical protein CTAYLR_008013 [Chrysophaeum taylorii]